ncbi:plasmid pRiA4b ORF-3 family protein [Inediibacterium massiliense]|uniref:plasmid pRiA4b ORF-3 family protein n=1 Tax=Inediibacterium massiliense TaxID=1658111 RepID=UPI0006B4AF77|nr:plasmid pRiA4b ORF-3 family protein [Inediibacterium massiliense]
MLIQCTKKLIEQLNIDLMIPEEENLLFSWHANLLTINRRKTIVLVNDKNRYIIVLHGLKAKDFKNLDEHIIQAIRETFQKECIKDEIIEEYIHHCKKITYTKTKNRSMVARMNKACELLWYTDDLLEDQSIYKSTISIKLSQYFVGNGNNDYIIPSEEMCKDLEIFSGQSVFGCTAAQLKITLALEKHIVWRKIIVPINITFKKLHHIIQASFGWKNYHLHEFYIYDHKILDPTLSPNHSAYSNKNYKPIINLVCDEEAFDYENDTPMKLETKVKLSEYLPSQIKYLYDFGDSWQHYIEVEKMINDYDKNYSVCIKGEGNTPPEDVGGEYGYEEFLHIIANKKHPQHDEMLVWAKSQGYTNFDIEKVNKDIKFTSRMK